MMGAWQRIILRAHKPVRLGQDELGTTAVTLLRQHYAEQVRVYDPSPQTGNQWQLAAQGWAGLVPVTQALLLELRPELAPANPWHLVADLYGVEPDLEKELEVTTSWLDFYNRLAALLARKVLERARRGLHRGYVEQSDHFPYIRGQVDIRQLLQRPWQVRLESHYEEHTPDIADNQILAWTLRLVAHSGLCDERSLPPVGRAYRALQRVVTLRSFTAQESAGYSYSRLNQDYRPLHLLCRFFLEHTGPARQLGERAVAAFLVGEEGGRGQLGNW
jgi:5-methylcytosine-specific restriction enzyme subunit McrC